MGALGTNIRDVSSWAATVLDTMAREGDSHIKYPGFDYIQLEPSWFTSKLIRYIELWKDGDEYSCNFHVCTALLYLKRLAGVTKRNAYRLFACALYLSAKFFDDRPPSLKDWARACFLPPEKLHTLEWAFCDLMQWNFNIHPDEFLTLERP